jgi:large subunit ribosomal protein L34
MKAKGTFQPNTRKMKKKHGFFSRQLAGTGILSRRRRKGRKTLSK